MPKTKEQCQELRDRMKNTILQKSMLYFAKNGFHGTKISDLSKHIGIGQGTIYVYFASKEDLFMEIMKVTSYEDELRKMKVLVNLPISAKEKLAILSKNTLKQMEEDEMFAAKIALNTQMLLEQSKEFSADETSYQSALYEYTAKIIQKGQKEGSMVNDNPMKLADYFWSVIYVYSLKRLFTTEYYPITEEDLCRVILK